MIIELGAGIKSLGIEQSPLVVVAQQANPAVLDDQIETLEGIRSVADNIAQAEDIVDALRANIGKHRLERLQVAVNVANNGPFQVAAGLGK